MKYTLKDRSLVTAEEKEQLQYLCYPDGLCWDNFLNRYGKVILCKEKDKIIGWAFIFNDDLKEKKYKTFFIYVHSLWRRKGIGTEIYRIAKEKFGNLWVSKYNIRAKGFFSSVMAR